MSDPLAGYTTDWRKRMEEDPLAGYTPDWRSRSDLGPDRRLESARGRREVEYETIQRQLEQYRKSMATAVGERRNRLERQIAGLEQEVSPFGLAATGGESLKRFGGGVLAGPSQMVLTLADLAAAPLQIAEGVVGRDAQWGRGIRNWIQEQQATIEEVTGSRGPEGLVGNLVGGIAGGVLQGITKGVPVLRLLTRGANIGGEGYARLANATLRFAGRAKPLEPFARASFEGGRLARAGGNIAADLPWNVVQIASADDMSTQDVLRSLGLSAVGAGVGGALSPKIPYKRPTFKPDLSDLGGNSRANADAHAQSMADQMEKIRIWQDAHPDKKWNDLSAEERAAVVGSDPATASKAVVKANEHLSMLSNVLRGFLVGENDMVEAARRAYNTMIEMGATPDQIWATLGITVKNGVPVTHDGKVPTPERMDIAAGNVPREVVAEARVQSDAKTHRSQRMNDLMNKARAEARTQRQERRKAERLALMDPLIETIQGPRAWQQAQASIEADEGTYLAKFDANNFKAVNDLGQAVGDEALKTIGNTISAFANAARLRAFRIGGDEFVIAGPLDAVAQVREQLEMVLYGQEFGGQKTSVSGGIGLTLREAELDLEPRKLASKKSLGQPLSRKDTEYIEKPIHEALPTVQVFKAVNEHGLGAIVRAAGTYPDSKRIRDFKPDVDPELVLTNAIEIETAARSVLGQWLEMSAAGIAPDKIRRVLARQYGLGDGGSEAVTRMPRPGVSRPTGDVSRPDVGGGPAPEAGPGTRGANRNVTDLRAAAQEAEDLWMHLQRTFPAPTRAQQKRIDFAEAQMRKARKAADLTEMPLQRVPVGEPPLRQGPETAPGVEPTDLATIEVTKRIKKNKLEPQVRQAAEDIASQTGDEPHINTEMAARSVLRQFEDHIASGLSPDEARARIDADTRDNLADPEVERVHPIQKELDNVPAMKAKWNALEDALEDLDPETAEFAKVQAEADALWAKIEALDGFSEAGAPTAEPRPATVSSPEPPAGTTPTPADPLQLETIRLPAPLAELGPNEIEGIIDNMLAPFDRNPELVGTKSWEQVQRDILKLREQYNSLSDAPQSGFALEQTPDEARLAKLMALEFDQMKEAQLTELNVLLQNVNNRLPPDAPRKASIVDKLLDLRAYQHEKEANKNRGRKNKSQPKAEDIDAILDEKALKRKKGTEGFTIPEAQAATVAFFTGGLLGYTAIPAEDENERIRNAMIGAALVGGGAMGTFYVKGKSKLGSLKHGPTVPGEDALDNVMTTTIFDRAFANITPARIVRGLWEGMDKLYARSLHPSLGGERIARILAQGQQIGKEVGDILATFGMNKRVVHDWFYRGPTNVDPETGQMTPVVVRRHDGTVATLEPVAAILQSVDGDIDKLGKTALALSAAEQWVKYGKTPHPDLDITKAEQFLRNVDQKYLDAAQKMRDLHLGLLDMQVEAGILTAKDRQSMAAEQMYTAMERLFGDGLEEGLGRNIGDKVRGLFAQRPVKARKGPNVYDIRNPVETLWIAISRTAKAVEINEKKAALISLWEASNVPEEIKKSFMRRMTKTQIEHATHQTYLSKVQAIKDAMPDIDPGTAERLLAAYDPSPLGPKSDFMTFLRDGETEVWRLSPELVQTFGYMSSWDVHGFWKAVGVGSNVARKGVAMHPGFVGNVAFWDVFQSVMNSEHGVRPGIDWITAFYDAWKKSPEYRAWGGGTAESTLLENLRNPRDILRASQAESRTVGGDVARHVVKGQLIQAYKKILVPFAEAGRFSEYLAARRHGADVQEAVRASMAVGGYFNQAGAYAVGMFHAVPFLKGITQSVDQAAYSAGAHPFRPYDGNRGSKALKWWGKGAAMIGLPTIYFYLANKDDEEIEQLRQTELGRRNWYFRLPDGGIMSVRKPAGPEGQLFSTSIEIMFDKWRNREPEAFNQFAGAMLREIQLPWAPPVVQAIGTLKTGTDLSFGSPLISERLQGLPVTQQHRSSTSDVSRTASKGLTDLFGEPDEGFWARALSPVGLDYIARTMGGTLAKEALQLADFGRMYREQGSIPAAREWPVLRRFLTVDMTRAQTRDMEDFYKYVGRAERVVGGLNQSLQEGDVQGFVDITQKHNPQEIAAMKMLLSTRSSLAQFHRAIEELREMREGDRDARNQIILNLRRSVIRQMGNALDAAQVMQ